MRVYAPLRRTVAVDAQLLTLLNTDACKHGRKVAVDFTVKSG